MSVMNSRTGPEGGNRNFCELKEHVLPNAKKLRTLKEDLMKCYENGQLEKNIRELMELKNTTRELREACKFHAELTKQKKGYQRNMDEPGNHHSQQTDTRTENQTLHVVTHRKIMQSKSMSEGPSMPLSYKLCLCPVCTGRIVSSYNSCDDSAKVAVKNVHPGQVQQFTSVIPALWEAEAGGSPEHPSSDTAPPPAVFTDHRPGDSQAKNLHKLPAQLFQPTLQVSTQKLTQIWVANSTGTRNA
ncbi:hypothetical protein AAY473_024307 [Plecturocebus cupreus]